MLSNYKFKLYYNVGSVGKISSENPDDFDVSIFDDGVRLKITLLPKKPLELVWAEIKSKYNYQDDCRVFVNGYQSWSESREYLKGEKLVGLPGIGKWKIARKYTTISGDYHIKDYPNLANRFHGYTFGYVRNGSQVDFVGSLSEREGYTVINYNLNENSLVVEKDVEGKTVSESYVLFDIIRISDTYDRVFDTYFEKMGITPPKMQRMCGYTTWYNYYNKITEKIVLRDLEAFDAVKEKVDVFQIDDGYQTAVGDWLSVDKVKFPSGMKAVADAIHQKGYKAGIWLAPLNAQKNSVVAKTHPDWLIKGDNGKPILTCVGWGGAYALDIDNEECRAYIRHFFDVILSEWGFDMVKLDFLYSAARMARNNKTHGQLMCEAMDFLRECVGDKLILGCGVPLGPSFGKVDMCRIGSDAEIQFKDRFYVHFTNREIISTKTALKNTMFRRCLNHRVFLNDPDVFFFRNTKRAPIGGEKAKRLKYTEQQKQLLAEVCSMFGSVLFTSDSVAEYDENQIKSLLNTYAEKDRTDVSVDYVGADVAVVDYSEGGKRIEWTINMATGENSKRQI